MNPYSGVRLLLLSIFLVFACNKDDDKVEEMTPEPGGEPVLSLEGITDDALFINHIETYVLNFPEITNIKRYVELNKKFESLNEAEADEYYTILGFEGRSGYLSYLDGYSKSLSELSDKYSYQNLSQIKRDSIARILIINSLDKRFALKLTSNDDITCMALSWNLRGTGDFCGRCVEDFMGFLESYDSRLVDAHNRCRAQTQDIFSKEFRKCYEATGLPALRRDADFLLNCCLFNECTRDPNTEEERCNSSLNFTKCQQFLS